MAFDSIKPTFREWVRRFSFWIEEMDQEAEVECASFVLIPRGQDATSAGMIFWLPERENYMAREQMFHELLCAMVWGMLTDGVTVESIHEAVDRAADYHVNLSIHDSEFIEFKGVN